MSSCLSHSFFSPNFFSFPKLVSSVRRKTDFFAGPPGNDNGSAAAIQKVNQVLGKHAKLYQQEQAAKNKKTKKSALPVPEKMDEDVIEMSNDGDFDVSSSSQFPAETKPAAAVSTPTSSPSAAEAPETSKDEKETPSVPPPIGNGGTVPGKYVWTQTLSELNVTIPVPDNTRGRDLNVTIARTHLKVGLRSKKNDFIVNAPLVKPIICDDSFWTVEDGNRLVLNLQKLNQMEWWDGLCQGDQTIDVKKIQPENSSLGDLDGETQKTVSKMMFDQRQKAMGLPTSEEQTKLDAIERFKTQHPELDFSNAKIS